MELTTAGIVAGVGILFGLNFIGLFVAAFIFDRRAVHVLWYLATAVAFMINGLAYVMSIITPFVATSLVFVEVFQGVGFMCLAYGYARAFSLALSRWFLWTMFACGVVAAVGFAGRPEIDVTRLTVLSAWHGMVAAYLAIALWRAPGASFKHRFVSGLTMAFVLAAAARPIMGAYVQTIDGLTYAEQIDAYGAVVSIAYLIAMFGIGAALFFHVMTDLASGYRRAALTDSLTGLFNRRGFLDAVEPLSARPACLIMLDIDRFKSVNDIYGHDIGDRVIAAVSTILGRHVAPPHVAGRLGGEEFAIVLHRTELSTATALAHALRGAIETTLDGFVANDMTVTASFGVATVGPDGIRRALIDADAALYQAKRDGRNRVCVAGRHQPLKRSRLRTRRHAAV